MDTGAGVNAFLVNFDPEGIGHGSFYDWIPDGEAWQFQGYDENGLPRSLNVGLRDAPEVLCSTLHQHQHQELQRLRAKNNKTSMWDTMVVT